ncbi:MAG: Ig-like domain-containing protein, partial [Actinobacteria bacterium]|nr:Ig-like domain-containing protein [Actinomycetota bacterium]
YVTPTPNVDQMIAGTVGEIAAGVEFCIDDGIALCDPLEPLDWTTVDDVNGTVWTQGLNLPGDGVYDIIVRGFDALGNRTDETSYAVKTLTVDSLTPAPSFSINEPTPFYLPDPINVADASLSGTRQDSYVLTLSNSPAVIYTLDTTTTDTTNWALAYTGLSSGNTIARFTIDNTLGTDTADARVLIVRDLIGPQLIVGEPLPGTMMVPTTSALVLTFSETMAPLTIDGTILTVEDEVGGAITFSVLPPAVSNLNRTYTFTPDSPFLASTRYMVQVFSTELLTITDQFGNAFMPSNSTTPWVFTTAP